MKVKIKILTYRGNGRTLPVYNTEVIEAMDGCDLLDEIKKRLKNCCWLVDKPIKMSSFQGQSSQRAWAIMEFDEAEWVGMARIV